MDDIKIYSLSFRGRRENNEDSYLELRPNSSSIFIAIADGMGGVAGGKKASESVIKCCKRIIEKKINEDESPDLKQILRNIYYESQKIIKEIIQKEPELNGMGTTLACVLIYDDKFVWGNLGDSRIYHLTKSGIKLITKDHTHIQDFIDKSDRQLSRNLISNYSNFLTRSIDGGTDEPDIFPDAEDSNILKNGECILICSDGLINNKADSSDKQFEEIIVGSKDIEDAARTLIDDAYQNGSTDNITVILLEKGKIKRKKITKAHIKRNSERERKSRPHTPRKYKRLSVFFGSMIIIFSFAILFFFLLKQETAKRKSDHILVTGNGIKKKDLNVSETFIQKNKYDSISTNSIKPIEESLKVNVDVKKPVKNVKTSPVEIEVVVPELIGLSLENVKSKLDKIALKYIVIYRLGSKEDIGFVVEQYPKAGKYDKKISTINLIVGK